MSKIILSNVVGEKCVIEEKIVIVLFCENCWFEHKAVVKRIAEVYECFVVI